MKKINDKHYFATKALLHNKTQEPIVYPSGKTIALLKR